MKLEYMGTVLLGFLLAGGPLRAQAAQSSPVPATAGTPDSKEQQKELKKQETSNKEQAKSAKAQRKALKQEDKAAKAAAKAK